MDFKTFIQSYNGDLNNKDSIISDFLKSVENERDLIQQKQLAVLLNHLNFIATLKKGFDDSVSKKNINLFVDVVGKVCSAFDAALIPAQIYAYFCYCVLKRIHSGYPCDEIKWVDPREFNLKNMSAISSSNTFGRGAYLETLNDFSFAGSELSNVKVDREIITIPHGVKTIGPSAFRGLKKVKYISIPNSVSVLPPNIFSGLESLEGVFISTDIKEIPSGAFKKCINLTNVIGSSITTIGDYAFESTKIVNLKRCGGENITRVGSLAFKNCTNLQGVNLPKAVVGPGAFAGCSHLTSLRISVAKEVKSLNSLFSENGATPTEITIKELNIAFENGQIPNEFFKGSSLNKLAIRNEIVGIGKSAFEDCISLEEIQAVFKSLVIQEKAFKKCEGLKTLPTFENVNEIGDAAFAGCKSLTSLTINGAVNKIGKGAFANCPELTTLNINYVGNSLPELCFYGSEKVDITPFLSNVEVLESHSFTGRIEKQHFNFWSKLKVVKANAFDQCEIKVENLTIPAHIRFEKLALAGLKPSNLVFQNPEIKDEQGNLIPPYTLFSSSLEEFVKDYESLIGVGVLDGVIPPEFFKGWANIEKARLAGPINVIPISCFEDCTNLEAVKVDAKNVKIEDRAFFNCTKLNRLLVGDTNVIDGGSLKLSAITGIGKDALQGCAGIGEIEADNNILNPLMFAGFKGVKKVRLTLNAPEGVSISFFNLFADTLETFNTEFANLKEVEIVSKGVIPDSFFKGCANIETINIQGQVDTIKDSAFMDCLRLKTLNLNYIGQDVPSCCFMNCSALEQLTLTNAENVGVSAFENCSSLSHLVLCRTIKQVDDKAFKNCSSLDIIPFEIAAENVGVEAFMGMSKIKELSMSNVNRIGEGAFSSCKELEKVFLKSVHKLEPLIFNNCQKITDFNLELAEDYSGDTRFYQLFENDINEFNCIYKLFKEITIKVNGILPSYFFEGITTVKKVNVIGDIKELGEGVFKDCLELEEIAISYNGESLSKELFLNCKKLVRGLVFASTSEIGESAFEGCEALEDVSFAQLVKVVGDKAFKNCINLKKMPFDVCPDNIGIEAFMGCQLIKNLDIVGASSIGERAFYDISHFDYLALEQLPNNETLKSIINHDAEIKEIDYRGGVIAPHFFEGMSKLEKVILPERDVEISHNAFSSCSSLKEIVNIDKAIYLGNECLSNCPIESLTINENAKYIGLSILKGCKYLKEINLPLNTTLGSLFSSFEFEDSIEVEHLLEDDSVKSYFIPKSLKKVVISKIKPYTGALSSLQNIDIIIDGDLEELPYSFLRNSNGNIMISHPEKIKVVGEYALSATKIGDLDLENVEEIKDYAFKDSPNIKKATFYQSLKLLSANAFMGTNLEQLNIIDNNNFLCECGFTVCKATKEIIFVDKDISGDVVVPDMITSIGTLLKGKASITSIDLNQVTSIDDEAFTGCSSLTSLKMSNQITSIGQNILKGVSSLDDLVIAFVGENENKPASLDYLNEQGLNINNLVVLKGQIAPNFANKKTFNKVDLSSMSYLALPDNAFIDCQIDELSLPNGTSLEGDTVFNNTDINVFNSDINHDDNFIYYNDTIYMCYHSDGVKEVIINEDIKGLNKQSFRGIKELDKLEIDNNLSLEKAFNQIKIKEIAFDNIEIERLDEEFSGSLKSLNKFTCAAKELATNFLKGFTALKELYLDYLEQFDLLLSVNNLDVLSLDSLKVINKNLTKVSYGHLLIGDNIEEIDYEAFKDIRAKEFDLMDNENFFVKDGMYIDKKNDCVYATNEECSGDILIPDYIEKIYDDAFRSRAITSIDTNNVVSIGKGAFNSCSELEKVIIGEKATDLAVSIFDKSKVKKLKFAKLPANYTGVASFFDNRSAPLEKVVVTSEQIYKRNYFAGLKYAKIIVISNETTKIETLAFNGCESLDNLLLPESVEKVEAKAFNGCLGIKMVKENNKLIKKKDGLTLIVKDLEQVAKFDKNFDLVHWGLFSKKKANITIEGWKENDYEL